MIFSTYIFQEIRNFGEVFKIHTRLNLSNRCKKETSDIYDDYQGIKEKQSRGGVSEIFDRYNTQPFDFVSVSFNLHST